MNKEAIALRKQADGKRWVAVSPSRHGPDSFHVFRENADKKAMQKGGSVMTLESYLTYISRISP